MSRDPGTDLASIRQAIAGGHTAMGLELGSTRIKAALTGPTHMPVATGSHAWSNQLVDGLWTYNLDDVVTGLRSCFGQLAGDVEQRYDVPLLAVGSLGVSAMMHGYLALDADGDLLVPFRTWRNTNTDDASRQLSRLFGQNIPHRWSIAHLYQAVLDDEEHLPRLAHLTTLAGYVHWRLSGHRVLGVGDASGVFPIDAHTGGYDLTMMAQFDQLIADRSLPWRLADVLPDVLPAGAPAGALTGPGALVLDPAGLLAPGVAMCPPEGDAGTGMVATNSVAPGTGNVSAGTSMFAMVVLDRPLTSSHPEIDLVSTPSGQPVGMVHCNNGTSELDSWIAVLGEFASALGVQIAPDRLFELVYSVGLSADPDAGGLLAYSFVSGEPIVGLDEGRPLLVRTPQSRFTLANLVGALLYGTVASLCLGMDILRAEGVRPQRLLAHGGFLTTEGVGQRVLAAALDTPVAVGDSAGQGGAWGMALLAAYGADGTPGLTLEQFLAEQVFDESSFRTLDPEPALVRGFTDFMQAFRAGLPMARLAVDVLSRSTS